MVAVPGPDTAEHRSVSTLPARMAIAFANGDPSSPAAMTRIANHAMRRRQVGRVNIAEEISTGLTGMASAARVGARKLWVRHRQARNRLPGCSRGYPWNNQ